MNKLERFSCVGWSLLTELGRVELILWSRLLPLLFSAKLEKKQKISASKKKNEIRETLKMSNLLSVFEQ